MPCKFKATLSKNKLLGQDEEYFKKKTYNNTEIKATWYDEVTNYTEI